MDLSIIIVSYNTKQLLKQCLDSLLLSLRVKGLKGWEIIIVDNGSTDGSVEFIKELTSSRVKELKNPLIDNKIIIRLIENKENLGFAKANNQGIKLAKGRYVLLLNTDTKIVDDALTKLVKFAERKKNFGVIGPKLLNADGSPQPSAAPFYTLPVVLISLFRGDRFLRRSPKRISLVDWLSGACFLINKKAVDKIGLLDEKFFMYVEEMEFCFRLKKAGYQIYFYPSAEVVHLVRGGQFADWHNKQKAILGIYRGLIYFYQKHFTPWQVYVLKFILRSKAVIGWLTGVFTNNHYLKETYAKAFRLA